jgi:hypothetical protein
MRAAVLYSKKTIDSMKKSNRDELFQTNGISEKEKQSQMGNEKVGCVVRLYPAYSLWLTPLQ